jgi:AcrR family transcriptional regulator
VPGLNSSPTAGESPDGPDGPDGRSLRRARNTDAVVDAMLDLLREGGARPGAQEIADRAGVSLRTVFRHFQDLDALLAVAVQRQLDHVGPLLDAEPPTGAPADRVAAVVAHRAALYEEVGPVRRAAVRGADFHEPLRVGLDWTRRRLRRHLEAAFAPELDRCSASRRALVVEALDAATSWAAWDTLRSSQGLSVRRAADVMTATVAALVTPR